MVIAVSLFLLIIVIATGISLARDNEKKSAQAAAQAAVRAKRAAFLADIRGEWPFISGGPDDLDFVMMSEDSSRFRFVTIPRNGTGIRPSRDITLQTCDIINVELKQDTETVTSVDVTTITKKKGALTRAAVGAVAFGGAGAIVGASSASSQSRSTGTHTQNTKIIGNRIIVGTTDARNPTITQKFSHSSSATSWYHRFLSAVTTCSSK